MRFCSEVADGALVAPLEVVLRAEGAVVALVAHEHVLVLGCGLLVAVVPRRALVLELRELVGAFAARVSGRARRALREVPHLVDAADAPSGAGLAQ